VALSNLRVEKIGITSLETVYELLEKCTKFFSSVGLGHWVGFYSRERIGEYLKERNFYLLFDNEVPVGTVASTQEQVCSGWFDSKPALYLSTLAVHPNYDTSELYTVLLNVVEDEARALGVNRVRFDGVQGCYWLNEFYQLSGYAVVGQRVRPYRAFDYFLFEKDLTAVASKPQSCAAPTQFFNIKAA